MKKKIQVTKEITYCDVCGKVVERNAMALL